MPERKSLQNSKERIDVQVTHARERREIEEKIAHLRKKTEGGAASKIERTSLLRKVRKLEEKKVKIDEALLPTPEELESNGFKKIPFSKDSQEFLIYLHSRVLEFKELTKDSEGSYWVPPKHGLH